MVMISFFFLADDQVHACETVATGCICLLSIVDSSCEFLPTVVISLDCVCDITDKHRR